MEIINKDTALKLHLYNEHESLRSGISTLNKKDIKEGTNATVTKLSPNTNGTNEFGNKHKKDSFSDLKPIRKDLQGIEIVKYSKKHKVSFSDMINKDQNNLVSIVEIENFKKYNNLEFDYVDEKEKIILKNTTKNQKQQSADCCECCKNQ